MILLDGTIQKGRWADNPGAHVKNHNKNTLAICYIGGLDENGKIANDEATPAQLESLTKLLSLLKDLYNLDQDKIMDMILGYNLAEC